MKNIGKIIIAGAVLLGLLTSCGEKYQCSFCKEYFRGEPSRVYLAGNAKIPFCSECSEYLGGIYDDLVN